MHVIAIGMNEGFAGARRARRFFPNGEEVRIEVLDQEDDPPDVKDASGKRSIPDPDRIGRHSFAQIKADPRIKLLADGETAGTMSAAYHEGLRRQLQEAGAENALLKADVQQLGHANADLAGRVRELEAQLAAARQVSLGGPIGDAGAGGKVEPASESVPPSPSPGAQAPAPQANPATTNTKKGDRGK
jgi:hypothetical protein